MTVEPPHRVAPLRPSADWRTLAAWAERLRLPLVLQFARRRVAECEAEAKRMRAKE